MPHLIVLKQRAYAEIEARYACQHGNRELRERTIVDGRSSFVSQCVHCGNTSQPIARKTAIAEAADNAIPLYDNELAESWRQHKSVEYREAFRALQPSLKREYDAYLSSDGWRKLRLKVLERSKYICELCEEAPATEVHHITYIRLGNELLADLTAVCHWCHEFLHTPTAA